MAQRPEREGYAAFISYSHAMDGKLAPAVQRGLQRFAKRWYEPRALRIFRDETSLSINPHLWASIESALSQSRYFILLASPRAAQSPWVEREVRWWRDNRPADRLLIVLTSGDLDWDESAGDFLWNEQTPLPRGLSGAFAAPPRHLDLRWAQNARTDLSLQHNLFREAIADLAATLHGRPKEELIGEEVTQHRRVRRLARGAVAGLALLTMTAVGAAIWALRQEERAVEQAEIAEQQRIAAIERLADFLYERAMLAAAQDQPRLSMALLYRLLADPELSAGVRDSEKIAAQLPHIVGDYVLETLSADVLTQFPVHLAHGVVNGHLAFARTVLAPESKRLELVDLVDEQVLASIAELQVVDLEELGQARFLGSDLLLLADYNGRRELLRFDRAAGELAPVAGLPPMPAGASDSAIYDDSRLSEDGQDLLIGSASFMAGTVFSHVLHLDSGQIFEVNNEGEVHLELASFGGTLSQNLPKASFRLLAAREGRALMVSGEVLALLDLRTGEWESVSIAATQPFLSAGLSQAGRLWLQSGQELVLLDLPQKTVVARLVTGADYITPVIGAADLVALQHCGVSVTLLSTESLQEQADYDLPAACDDYFAPHPPSRVGNAFAVLGKGRHLAYALHLFIGEERHAVELPFSVHMDLGFDAELRWVAVDPGSQFSSLAPIARSQEELMEIARQELGPDAQKDLDELLAEFER